MIMQHAQYVLYKLVPKGEKFTKLPVSPTTFSVVSAHDSQHWTTKETAEQMLPLAGPGHGLAYVLTDSDPYFFVDIDNCYANGQWSQLATSIINMFPNAMVEVSQSGTGLHIIGSYTGEIEHACKDIDLGLELYTAERFIALTLNGLRGSCEVDCTNELKQLVDLYFQPKQSNVNDSGDWRDVPVAEWSGPEDDEQLIERMCKAKNAKNIFGNKVTFHDLFTGNCDKLAESFPSQNDDDPYDRSSADMSLASSLAFWTGKNHSRMLRIMQRSALVRDKWTKHKHYMNNTILNATRNCENVYHDGSQEVNEASTLPMTATFKTGVQMMTQEQQVTYFQDCIYIQDQHKVMTKDGSFLAPDQFKASYGGWEFIFSSEGKTKTNAFEIFTESQLIDFPKAQSSCFRPEHKPYEIIEEEGRSLVNTYIPIPIESEAGNAGPFMDHLALLIPDERDREILLSYMAACVQFVGSKFQWCPLIQGTEGNGKTLIVTVLSKAIGDRYTHLPNASDLGGNGAKFNSWIQNKLLIGIEEIYVADRREVTEALKPLITNSRIEIQGKGKNQVTGDNRANFVMCSNHKDALPVTIDGRRYCIFYTNQQRVEDKDRDGMTNEYFYKLYKWLDNGGYKHVTHYLQNYEISDMYNPARGCNVAPSTTSTQEAIDLTRGNVEQEILEAISESRTGFANGWVSSISLEQLLVKMRKDRAINSYKRDGLMESLGYILHPSLPDGRAPHMVAAQGGRPKLYMKRGHLAMNINEPSQVVAKFCEDQQFPAGFGEECDAVNK
jgi:primase-polymerase (primpol)-like protein